MGYLKSARELAPVLGVGKSKAAELAKEPWLAALRRADGWDEDEVRRAIAARDRRDPGAPLAAQGEDLAALEHGAEDPVAAAKAALNLAARRLASAVGPDVGSALEGVKRALEELRRTEDGYLELARKRGTLIEREVAKRLAGEAVGRGVRTLERFEVQLASKVEEWVGSPDFRLLAADERARRVRAWAHELGRSLRDMNADELEKLIAADAKS